MNQTKCLEVRRIGSSTNVLILSHLYITLICSRNTIFITIFILSMFFGSNYFLYYFLDYNFVFYRMCSECDQWDSWVKRPIKESSQNVRFKERLRYFVLVIVLCSVKGCHFRCFLRSPYRSLFISLWNIRPPIPAQQ